MRSLMGFLAPSLSRLCVCSLRHLYDVAVLLVSVLLLAACGSDQLSAPFGDEQQQLLDDLLSETRGQQTVPQAEILRERHGGRALAAPWYREEVSVVARGAPLAQLAQAIAQASGGSLVYLGEASAPQTMDSLDINVGELLHNLASSQNLKIVTEQGVAWVVDTRHPLGRQEQRVVRYQLYQADPGNVSTAISRLLGTESTGMRVLPDAATGGLLVQARDPILAQVDSLVELLDTNLAQIHVECWLVEVSQELDKRIGIALSANEDGGVRGHGEDGTVFNLLPQGNSGLALLGSANRLWLALEAFQTERHSKVLANPRLVVRERVESELFQGQEVPYTTQSNNAGTKTEFRQAGIRLKVLAHRVGDSHVSLRLRIAQDAVEPGTANPPISRREMETHVVIPQGQLAVIGGIEILRSGTDRRSNLWLGRGKSVLENRSRLYVFVAASPVTTSEQN